MKIPTLQDYLDSQRPKPEPVLPNFPKEIGLRIRKQRLAFQWRQQDLASKADISVQTIKALEKGESISLTHFLKIMLVLGHGRELLTVLDRPHFKDFESIDRFSEIEDWEDQNVSQLKSKRVTTPKSKSQGSRVSNTSDSK